LIAADAFQDVKYIYI